MHRLHYNWCFSCAVTSEAYRSVAEASGWESGVGGAGEVASGPRMGAGSDLTRRGKRRGAGKTVFQSTLDFAGAPPPPPVVVVMVLI